MLINLLVTLIYCQI